MAAAANIQALSVIAALVLSAQAVPQTTKIVHEKHVAHARAASSTTTALGEGSSGLSGKALAKCDRSTVVDAKYPTTGWRRTDYCSAEDSDHGSHFVCVNMPSDFWVKTGQASSIADAQANWPQPGPWCICMWAYADYLTKEPSFSDDVICDATNEWVLQKYDKSVPSQCQALLSLCKKCSLSSAVCPSDC